MVWFRFIFAITQPSDQGWERVGVTLAVGLLSSQFTSLNFSPILLSLPRFLTSLLSMSLTLIVSASLLSSFCPFLSSAVLYF